MRTVSKRLADLPNSIIPIGFAGENLHTQVRLDSKAVFDEYPGAIASLTVQPPEGMAYPAFTTCEGDVVVWDVNDSDLVYDGEGEIQLAFIVGEIVVKSFIGRIKIARSIIPTGEAPTPIENWINEANEALGTISGAVSRAETAADKAETAQGKAEDAQTAAETAQGKAEDAQTAAETAQGKAEDAQDAAETAQGLAEDARDAAEGYASSADADANRAEQAANNLGYLEMEIVNGHLIYRKTELVDVDFDLVDGHLIMEVS